MTSSTQATIIDQRTVVLKVQKDGDWVNSPRRLDKSERRAGSTSLIDWVDEPSS
jgi:hypothetical protein